MFVYGLTGLAVKTSPFKDPPEIGKEVAWADIAPLSVTLPPLGKNLLVASSIVVSIMVELVSLYNSIGLYGLYFATDIWSSLV